MPTYTGRCSKCGSEQDYIARVDDRDKTPSCCSAAMERVLAAPMVSAMGIADHFVRTSPINGRPVYGRTEFLKQLKTSGFLPESDLKGEVEHQRKQIDAKNKADIRKSIVEAIGVHGG